MVHLSLARYASIGFLGLGNMGKHMATNLIAAKHQVTIFDVNPQALDHFKDQKQAKVVSVPQNAVDHSDFVILMLPNGKIVRDVCQSNIFPGAKKGTVIIDCSTIDVRTSKEMAQASRKKSLRFVDAPETSICLGGGVWRIKPHPIVPGLVLAACMHNGFAVVKMEGDKAEVIETYSKHGSLAYGADWQRGESFQDGKNKSTLVATCSFYDRLLRLWMPQSDIAK